MQMDMHIHTNWTDGKNSMEEMIFEAEKLNLEEIAFTDHIRTTSSYYDDYVKSIEAVSKITEIKIRTGYEAKICDFFGNIDVAENVAKRAEVRIASVHRFPVENGLKSADTFSKEEAQNIEKELTVNAITNNSGLLFNIIGHCGGMSISKFGEFPEDYFDEIIKLCVEFDIAFEINYRYHTKYLRELNSKLTKYNPYVTFGTDAHKQEDMKIERGKQFG